MKKISFIITAFNEEGNIKELYRQIEEVTSIYENYMFEYIFVDNGSADDTYSICKELQDSDKRIKILKLSRNFGFDGGITAGIDYSNADAVVIMTEWNEFRSLDLKRIKSEMRGNIFLDTRNIISMDALHSLGFNYDNVGRIKK